MKIWLGPAGRPIVQCGLYFLVLVACQAMLGFGRGFGYDSAHLAPFSSGADQLLAIFGMTDFAAYIKGARMFPILHMRTFTGGFGMYPPGLSIIEYVLLKLWPGAPLFAVLFFSSMGLWAVFLTLLSDALKKAFSLKLVTAFFLPLGLLAFPFFSNDYLWYDVGLTECLASPLFAIGCVGSLLLYLYPTRKIWIAAIPIGLAFAAASYIRAQFDPMVFALSLAAFLCLVAGRPREIKPYALALLALFATYQAATVPYRIFKHAPTIVTMDYAWGMVWTKRQDAEKYHVYVDEGMQSICEANMPKCQEFTDRRNKGEDIDFREYRSAAFSTMMTHPLEFLQFKLPIFWDHWKVDMFEPVAAPFSYRFVVDCILAVGIAVAALYACLRRRWIGAVYTLHAAAFVSACLIFSLIVHIEPRYFLPVKLFAAVSLLFVAVDAVTRQRKVP